MAEGLNVEYEKKARAQVECMICLGTQKNGTAICESGEDGGVRSSGACARVCVHAPSNEPIAHRTFKPVCKRASGLTRLG